VKSKHQRQKCICTSETGLQADVSVLMLCQEHMVIFGRQHCKVYFWVIDLNSKAVRERPQGCTSRNGRIGYNFLLSVAAYCGRSIQTTARSHVHFWISVF